jgi:hypothetical protein
MYAACLFCNKPLGNNEAIENFPVGQRLAFDPSKGRLWVVCRQCERWNLSPLEERWEAIEQSEKLYRDTRRRVSTENIGLAKLRDGTTLVRIGEPLRPEFAAWRYGDQFGRRRRRQILAVAGGIGGLGALTAGIAAAGVAVGAFSWLFLKSGANIIHGDHETVVARIRTEKWGTVPVRRRHLAETRLSTGSDGSIAIDLRFINGSDRFEGREAQRIAGIIVPKVNRFGGNRETVADAVAEIDAVGSAEGYVESLARSSRMTIRNVQGVPRWRRSHQWSELKKYGLFALPNVQRLALEMALHEEAERRALQGELEELERAWREAEEIASISDKLLVPESIEAELRKMRENA